MPTDGTVQTLSDGTVITYDSDGHPIRQVTPDGSVFDRFTPDGRPLHGTVPGSDGQPAQSVDITYQGNASTWRYTDGTTVTYNNDGNVVRQQLPDGTVFDQFTADGKPTHGILAGNDGQPAQTVDITYQGNASTWRYADGTTVTYNDDGNVTRQQLPDGTVFDQFTPDGRPLHGTVPGSDGQPAQSVDITYQGDASTWRYTDGTTVTYNDDGNVVRQQLPDGTVFDQFTADGKPTHGILAGNDGQPAQAVDITYQGDASTWRYADGTTVTYNDDGNVTRQRLPDGTVFDQFTTDGKPTHGTIPPSDGQPAQTVDITYQGDTSSWRYADGTTVTYNDDGNVTHQQLPDGSVFDRFTADGRPTHGVLAGNDGQPAQAVDITYQGNASTWRYADGTTVTYNDDGNVTRQRLPDGTVFDQFTTDGKPTHGTIPPSDGQPAQTVDITYQGDTSSWRYADGTTVTYNNDGNVTHQQLPDGSVFDRFTADGRPTHGVLAGNDGQPAQAVDITYQGNASTWHYTDGTTVTYNDDGNVTRQQLPDGTVFDQFTPDGKPLHGVLAGSDGQPAQSVDITYQGDASTWHYADGTTVTYNDDGNVTRQQLPDGTVFDQFTPDGKPLHGVLAGSDGQPAQSVDITYQGDASTWHYTDGTTVTYNNDGNVTRQQLPDGTVFDQFTADGKPTHGILAGSDGQPAQSVDITYQGDASTWHYADGTTVTYNNDGNVTHQQLPDGSVFDRFTADGKPTHGTVPGSDGQPTQSVDITYQGDTSTWRYTDGTTVTYNTDGNVTHQQLPDGTVFDQFTPDGKPTHGVLAGSDGQPPQNAYITYNDNGSTWTFDDGTIVVHDTAGNVVQQTTP
ncbi:RHS repeat domain-containing protein, partial [Micromonospora polyrhachis]